MSNEMKQVQIMFEQIRSDVKAVAEGHSIIRKEIQEAREDLGNRIDTVETAVRSNSKQLKEINQNLKDHIHQSAPPAHVAV